MPAPSDTITGFIRKILLPHPELLILSVCGYCGLSIIAGSSESLDRDEDEHREHCAPPETRAYVACSQNREVKP